MKKKLKFILPVLVLLIAGGVYYKISHKAKPVKLKVAGTIYLLPQDFLINLSDGQFAKLAVALVLDPGQSDGASAASAADASSGSNTGDTLGTLPEEAMVRAIITNQLTNDSSTELLGSGSRAKIEREILTQITKQTDLKVAKVLMPDLTVQ